MLHYLFSIIWDFKIVFYYMFAIPESTEHLRGHGEKRKEN